MLHAGRARCQVVAVMYRVHLHFWLLAALSTAPSDVAQEPGQSIKPHGTALRFFLQKDFGLKAFFFFFSSALPCNLHLSEQAGAQI